MWLRLVLQAIQVLRSARLDVEWAYLNLHVVGYKRRGCRKLLLNRVSLTQVGHRWILLIILDQLVLPSDTADYAVSLDAGLKDYSLLLLMVLVLMLEVLEAVRARLHIHRNFILLLLVVRVVLLVC